MRFFLLIALSLLSSLGKAQTCSMHLDSTADCGLTCSGGAIAYPTGQAPFSYLWQPGGQTTQQISNLCPGSYTVTVTDSLSCIAIDSITVNGSPILNVWISSVTNPSCAGCTDGSASGNVNGGTPAYYPYWTPPIGFGLYTVSGIGAGVYQFCVIDSFGCESCTDTILQEPLGVMDNSDLPTSISTVEIFDLTGRRVCSDTYTDWLIGGVNKLTPEIYLLIGKDSSGEIVVRKMIGIVEQ